MAAAAPRSQLCSRSDDRGFPRLSPPLPRWALPCSLLAVKVGWRWVHFQFRSAYRLVVLTCSGEGGGLSNTAKNSLERMLLISAVIPCNTMQYHVVLCNTVQYHAIPCNTIHFHAIPCNTIQYNKIPCNTMQYHARPCNTMQYHAMQYRAIPCNTMQFHAIPCNNMQYHAIPCNTMQYHAIPCNSMQ